MENKQTEITILKEEKVTKEGKKFDAFKFNNNGKKADLSFRMDSENLKVIPYGVSKVIVENLNEDKKAWYPRFYATFKSVVEKVENQ